MATTGFGDFGEEYVQKVVFRGDQVTRDTTVDILLFNDGTDALSDADDVGAITTEPTGSAYERQTVTLDSSDVSISQTGGNIEIAFSVTFDTSDSTATVDAWAGVIDFAASIVADDAGTATSHLLTATTFSSGSIDLSTGNDQVTVNATLSLD